MSGFYSFVTPKIALHSALVLCVFVVPSPNSHNVSLLLQRTSAIIVGCDAALAAHARCPQFVQNAVAALGMPQPVHVFAPAAAAGLCSLKITIWPGPPVAPKLAGMTAETTPLTCFVPMLDTFCPTLYLAMFEVSIAVIIAPQLEHSSPAICQVHRKQNCARGAGAAGGGAE